MEADGVEKRQRSLSAARGREGVRLHPLLQRWVFAVGNAEGLQDRGRPVSVDMLQGQNNELLAFLSMCVRGSYSQVCHPKNSSSPPALKGAGITRSGKRIAPRWVEVPCGTSLLPRSVSAGELIAPVIHS